MREGLAFASSHNSFLSEVVAAERADDELREKGCAACDVCLGELQRVSNSQLIAQKILSCVVRCDQRYGAAHITDVIVGTTVTAGARETVEGVLCWANGQQALLPGGHTYASSAPS